MNLKIVSSMQRPRERRIEVPAEGVPAEGSAVSRKCTMHEACPTAYCLLPTARYSRGFTLLISVILTSVILSIGLTLLDIAYKQIQLSSSAKNSQYAFYAADAALECALYFDQQLNRFAYDGTAPPAFQSLTPVDCNGQTNIPVTQYVGSPTSTAVFAIPCGGGGFSASTTVYKGSTGSTAIYVNGYNSCNSADPRRIERGLRVVY